MPALLTPYHKNNAIYDWHNKDQQGIMLFYYNSLKNNAPVTTLTMLFQS